MNHKGAWTTLIIYILTLYFFSPMAQKIRAILGDETINYLSVIAATVILTGALFWAIFKRKETGFRVYGWLIIITVTIAYILSRIHTTEMPIMIIYAVMAFMAFYAAKKSKLIHPYLTAIAIVIGASIIDELFQLIIPGRNFELADIELSIASSALMLTLFLAIKQDKIQANNWLLGGTALAFIVTLFSKTFAGYTAIIIFMILSLMLVERLDFSLTLQHARLLFFGGVLLAVAVLSLDLIRGKTISIGMLQIIALIICIELITKALTIIKEKKPIHHAFSYSF